LESDIPQDWAGGCTEEGFRRISECHRCSTHLPLSILKVTAGDAIA
jgi:hypothetical protein